MLTIKTTTPFARAKHLPKLLQGFLRHQITRTTNKQLHGQKATLPRTVGQRDESTLRRRRRQHDTTTTDNAKLKNETKTNETNVHDTLCVSKCVCVCLLCEKRVSLCMYNTPKRQCEKKATKKKTLKAKWKFRWHFSRYEKKNITPKFRIFLCVYLILYTFFIGFSLVLFDLITL